ncbi:hypothetical protein ACFSHQ_01520 [Gemmobacter lanyuensis]
MPPEELPEDPLQADLARLAAARATVAATLRDAPGLRALYADLARATLTLRRTPHLPGTEAAVEALIRAELGDPAPCRRWPKGCCWHRMPPARPGLSAFPPHHALARSAGAGAVRGDGGRGPRHRRHARRGRGQPHPSRPPPEGRSGQPQ